MKVADLFVVSKSHPISHTRRCLMKKLTDALLGALIGAGIGIGAIIGYVLYVVQQLRNLPPLVAGMP